MTRYTHLVKLGMQRVWNHFIDRVDDLITEFNDKVRVGLIVVVLGLQLNPSKDI